MRNHAELRRDLQDVLDDLPRVLALPDLTAAEAREYCRIQRATRLRLFWLRRAA
jgi:hypothetical protein